MNVNPLLLVAFVTLGLVGWLFLAVAMQEWHECLKLAGEVIKLNKQMSKDWQETIDLSKELLTKLQEQK